MDPLSKRRFVGTAQDLEVMGDWTKAEEEIEKKAQGTFLSQADVPGDSKQADKGAVAAKARAAKKNKATTTTTAANKRSLQRGQFPEAEVRRRAQRLAP